MSPSARQTSDERPFIQEAVPTPEAIRERIERNIQENRLLRSLYRIARKAEQQCRREAHAHA